MSARRKGGRHKSSQPNFSSGGPGGRPSGTVRPVPPREPRSAQQVAGQERGSQTGRRLGSSALALLILVTVVTIFNAGQEVGAVYSPHDDYNFLLRSESMTLARSDPMTLTGSHLAPIKEILYPQYIALSRFFGFSLRRFEELSYALACFCLWFQLAGLTKSRLVAWMTMLPLTVFSYQNYVFYRATYDALQLVLTPLTLATAILLFRRSCDALSLTAAALVLGAQVLTRPEGSMFALPPVVAILFSFFIARSTTGQRPPAAVLARQLLAIALTPFVFQQAASAYNMVTFGFRAPTVIQSGSFQACLVALEKISPPGETTHPYTPFPKASMQLAYKVSPTFRKTQGFLSQQLDGKGWSAHAPPGHRSADGSIGGGHFQWALYDAGFIAAGPRLANVLGFFKKVTGEIQAAFDRGVIQKRRVISPVLGPSFSLLESRFYDSFLTLAYQTPSYQSPSVVTKKEAAPQVEYDFDRLALRNPAVIEGSPFFQRSATMRKVAPNKIISPVAEYYIRALIVGIPVLVFLIIYGWRRKFISSSELGCILFVTTIGISVFLPRTVLFAAIDAEMFPGSETRYMSAGACAAWFVVSFLGAAIVRPLIGRVQVLKNRARLPAA